MGMSQILCITNGSTWYSNSRMLPAPRTEVKHFRDNKMYTPIFYDSSYYRLSFGCGVWRVASATYWLGEMTLSVEMIGYSCYWVDTTTNGGPTTTSLTNFEEWTMVEETNTSQTGKNGRCSYSRGAAIGRPSNNSNDWLGVALWPYSCLLYTSPSPRD